MVRNTFACCRALVASCLCCLALSGCAVQQLHNDHDQIRTTLLDLYTNQIIDNLIRASNGLPIIQLDYTNATAQVIVGDTESVGDSIGSTTARVTTTSLAPGLTNTAGSSLMSTLAATPSTIGTMTATAMSTLAKSFAVMTTQGFANTFNATSMHSNSNQVALTATPVTTSNDVYDNYISFLGLGSRTDETRGPTLLVSDKPPPPESVQICKKCGKLYYWVPIEYRREFFQLSLTTTAQRGKPMLAPDEFYTANLKSVLSEDRTFPDKQKYTLKIDLDKKIPNGNGRVVFSDGRNYSITAIADSDPPPAEIDKINLAVDFDDKTKAPLSVASLNEFKERLAAASPVQVKIYVNGYRPQPPTTTDLLNRLSFQLQLINFSQHVPGGGI